MANGAMPLEREGGELRQYSEESPEAVEFRKLLLDLDSVAEKKPFRTILLTSARHAEGKTSAASRLAITQARQGRA